MIDAIKVSRVPVIFSHSSARALANHARNVPDSILAMMKQNGGVVMVNIFPGFINPIAAKQTANVLDKMAEFQKQYPNDPDKANKAWTEWFENMKLEPGTLSEVADHVEHIVKIAGIDHVGIGADFGSLTTHPVGLEDVSKYPYLTAELLRRGWKDEDVKKFLGLNLLRVMRAVEQGAEK
jgi:membrane dipeptidase